MGGVGMRGKKSVERFGARHTRGRKPASNIVQLFICLVVDLLLGNGQHLAEVALYGGLHCPVALDVVQVPRAEDHEGRGGQGYGEFEGEHQPGSFVPTPFRVHDELLIRAATWISPAGNILERKRACVNWGEKYVKNCELVCIRGALLASPAWKESV